MEELKNLLTDYLLVAREKIENTVSDYFRVHGKMKRRENEERFYLLIFALFCPDFF